MNTEEKNDYIKIIDSLIVSGKLMDMWLKNFQPDDDWVLEEDN